jgi:hypothetical protein
MTEIISSTFFDKTFTYQIGVDGFETINKYECMITCKKTDGKTFVLNASRNNEETNVTFNVEDGNNELTEEDLNEMDARRIFDELKLENNLKFLTEFPYITIRS